MRFRCPKSFCTNLFILIPEATDREPTSLIIIAGPAYIVTVVTQAEAPGTDSALRRTPPVADGANVAVSSIGVTDAARKA